MNGLRKFLCMAVGVSLVLLLMAGLAPRAAHAVLAELVEVTNTTAHPVPTHEVSTPTRTPFQMEQTTNFSQQIYTVIPLPFHTFT